jgi:hypothetical protein
MVRVAPLGLVEHVGDDLGGVLDDAGGDPLVDGLGPRRRRLRRVAPGVAVVAGVAVVVGVVVVVVVVAAEYVAGLAG